MKIEAEYEGIGTVGFNARYLMDVLNVWTPIRSSRSEDAVSHL